MNKELQAYVEQAILPVTNISTVPTDPNTPGQSSNRVWHWPGITRSIGRWFTQLRPTTTWDWRKDGRCTISIREILAADTKLRQWFSPQQIAVMREAVEDHRASSDHEPRTIYGRIVAEADRCIDPPTIVRRTIQYGLANYPELDREDQYRRCVDHLTHKYAEGGYLRLWIPESDNALRLARLRELIRNRQELRRLFDEIFDREMAANG